MVREPVVEVSAQTARLIDSLGPFATFGTDPELYAALARPQACDFVFGNPHELPSPEYVEALTRGIQPQGPGHYAYKMNEPSATEAIARSLRRRFGVPFERDDVYLTNGNFSGLSILLHTFSDPGDEIIYVSPPWFFYEAMIVAAGATPVRTYADRKTFDIDVDAIRSSITSRTRGIIVNSPNNPSGRIYPKETLDALAAALTEASHDQGRPIWLFSDEAYNRIVYEGCEFVSPATRYPWSFLVYTYGKTHLAPGNRLGYVAVPPSLPGREELRVPMMLGQVTNGWAFPVAPLQHALPMLEDVSIDVRALQRRRDALVDALRSQGYELIEPEGTFYIMVRAPIEDDFAFFKRLAVYDVFVLPGSTFEMPGWFRISVTANDDMVERGIPGFAKALAETATG